MKERRESIRIPLDYVESQYSLFANKKMKQETLADLISYADTHDLKWEYVDIASNQKGWLVWDDHSPIHVIKTGINILKILKKHGLEVRKNLWGNLVLCEATG